jgi:hypothetical protein
VVGEEVEVVGEEVGAGVVVERVREVTTCLVPMGVVGEADLA